jgi:hypothetical protein
MKRIINTIRWNDSQYLIRIVFRFLCIVSLIILAYSPVKAQTVNCSTCCHLGVQDSSEMYNSTCPPGMNDAIITFNVTPTGSDPVDFYLYMEDQLTYSLVIDTFFTSPTSIDVDVCVGNSCYTTFMFTNDSANVEIKVFVDEEEVNTFGPGYISTSIGYACCNDLSISLSGIDPGCPNFDNGSVQVNVNGGKKPYTFIWVSAGDTVGTNKDRIESLTPGTYTVTVTDDAACTQTGSQILSQTYSALTLSSLSIDVSCFGATDGSIDLSVIGGTPPYSFLWSNGATVEDLLSSGAGLYYVTVHDSFDCSNSSYYIVEQPESLKVKAVPTDVSSFGGSDGSVNLWINGGTQSYSFAWSNGETTQHLSGIPAGQYVVTVTDINLCEKIDTAIVTEPSGISPTWTYTNTANTHSIVIPDTIPISVDGVQICAGDYLGVFYDSLGTPACGGYIQWLGTSIIITANGVNAGNDGFASGEEFMWKLWRYSDGQEYICTAAYIQPPGMPNTSEFAASGLSGLSSLIAYSLDYQYINLPAGWSIWSTYIDPDDADISNLFFDKLSSLKIVKDGNGKVYWPEVEVDQIGALTIGEGYRTKMNITEIVTITGTSVVPEITPVILPEGWSILGYLRQDADSVQQMMNSIVTEILIMKDENGFVFWPIFGANQIGAMLAGKGYQIKMYSQQIFTYPANSIQTAKSDYLRFATEISHHKNTGNNMTLGLLDEGHNFKTGDRIAVYSQDGILVGSSYIEKNFTVVSIWGDDETTNEKEGMDSGEHFIIRYVDSETNKQYELLIHSWLEGNSSYEINKIAVAETEFLAPKEDYILFQNVPNPFSLETKLSFYLPESVNVELAIIDVFGRQLELAVDDYLQKGIHHLQFRTDVLTSGTYYYRLCTGDYSETKKMIILR